MEKYREIIKMLVIMGVLYLVITLFLVPANYLGGQSFMTMLLTQMTKRIPFGNLLGRFSLYLTTKYLPLSVNDQFVYVDIFYAKSTLGIMEAVSELCLLGIVFNLINYVLSFIFHITEGYSPIRIIERILVNLIAAILALPIVTVLINALIVYISQTNVDWIFIVPYFITLVSIGGSMAMTLLVFAFSTMTMGVIFYLLRFVILTVMKLLITYVFAFSLLICLIEGHIGMFFANYLVIILIFVVIVLMDIVCNKLFVVVD